MTTPLPSNAVALKVRALPRTIAAVGANEIDCPAKIYIGRGEAAIELLPNWDWTPQRGTAPAATWVTVGPSRVGVYAEASVATPASNSHLSKLRIARSDTRLLRRTMASVENW